MEETLTEHGRGCVTDILDNNIMVKTTLEFFVSAATQPSLLIVLYVRYRCTVSICTGHNSLYSKMEETLTEHGRGCVTHILDNNIMVKTTLRVLRIAATIPYFHPTI